MKFFLSLAISILIISSFAPAQAAEPYNFQSDFKLIGVGQVPDHVKNSESNYWPFSGLIDYFLTQGVRSDIIYLILAVPFITFVIAFLRQVIGISTFGLYTPMLLSLSFMLLGIIFGVGVLIMIIIISYILRNIINRLNLLYIPRISFLLSCTALSFFFIMWLSLNFNVPIAIGFAIFPMLMISTISERISSAQVEEGILEALRGIIQTIIVAVIAYYVVVWPWLIMMIMAYPEIVILPLVGSLMLGRFTGLRLIEYFRFRSLFRDNIEE